MIEWTADRQLSQRIKKKNIFFIKKKMEKKKNSDIGSSWLICLLHFDFILWRCYFRFISFFVVMCCVVGIFVDFVLFTIIFSVFYFLSLHVYKPSQTIIYLLLFLLYIIDVFCSPLFCFIFSDIFC